MPRKALERSSFYPYHVCNKSIDGAFYPVDQKALWHKCCDLLCTLSWMYGVNIHAFVLMSNHYHLLLSTPHANLDAALRYFQSNLSAWLTQNTSQHKYAFKGRYNWSIIKDPLYYANVYRYVYQNPVRAGMTTSVETYAFSTIGGKHGLFPFLCPLAPHEYDGCLPDTDGTELEWLNFPIEALSACKIRLGLRRATFTPPSKINLKQKGVG